MPFFDRSPSRWLVLGALLVAIANVRFGIGLVAWVSWVPFLRFLRHRPGWRSGLATLGVLVLAWSLAVAKICTEPIPVVMSPMYGIPLAITTGGPMLLFTFLRRRLAHPAAAALFPAAMVVGEWAQHALTPFGSWGAAAYTQLDVLPLLQLAAITGLAGPSFLVYLGNVAIEELIERADGARPLATVTAALVAATVVLGQVRLAANEGSVETLRVAAVGTDATFGGLPLPETSEKATVDASLERRIRQGAAGGARLVVSTEASTLVLPKDEDAWLPRWRKLADELDVSLVLAYIVPLSTDPLRFENKAVVIQPDGTIGSPWLKHHPVPGEPSVAGVGMDEPASIAGSRMGTAICYDADFGRLGLAFAGQGIDLLALPSSDWRGIDPIHTEMTRIRAIEGGYGVVRSTRFGRSAVVDAVGRVRGFEGAFDLGDRVLIAELPAHGQQTVYARLGDWLIVLCVVGLGAALVRAGTTGVHSPRWRLSSVSQAAPS